MKNIFRKNSKTMFCFFKTIIVIFVFCIACSVMLTLITFNPFDDSYFQFTGNSCFYNIFGKLGALLSDFLFFSFGIFAYIIPCIMFFLCWIAFFRNRLLNLFEISHKILGSVMLLSGCCGLAECLVDDFYYCFSGGIIGFLLRRSFFSELSDFFVDIIFLLVLILGWILLSKDLLFCVLNKILNLLDCCLLAWKKGIRYFVGKQRRIGVNKFIIFNINIKYFINNKYYQKIKDICRTFIKIEKAIRVSYAISAYIRDIFLLTNKYFSSDRNVDNSRICSVDIIKNSLSNKNLFLNNLKFNIPIFSKMFLNQKITDNQYKKLNSIKFYNDRKTYFLDNVEKTTQLKTDNVVSIIKSTSRSMNYMSFEKQSKLSKKRLNFFPSIDLLSSPPSRSILNLEILNQKSKLLELKLADYHIRARVVNIVQGPVVTRFELDLAPGLKSARISSLSKDLARSLLISNLKVVEIIPGTPYVGLEIPNKKREMIYLREILDSKIFKESSSVLTLGFGKSISNKVVIANLDAMPHLLIAGTTGSGKSVGINSMIMSILYKATPEDVRFIMIDPKILELSIYEGIPHLLMNVVTNMKDIIHVLNWCVEEMDRRYKLIASCGARNLRNYNDRVAYSTINNAGNNSNHRQCSSRALFEKLPYIVIIVDEFSDLIMSDGKQVEALIIRLSQKARACGMHLILATQRPSVNVITGLIKANIPGRIAFAVSSKIDSRTILDQSGAESLLGMGDMLYLPPYSFIPIRVHGAFVCDEEVSLIVKHWKNVYN